MYRDNRKGNGNYYRLKGLGLGLYRDTGKDNP